MRVNICIQHCWEKIQEVELWWGHHFLQEQNEKDKVTHDAF